MYRRQSFAESEYPVFNKLEEMQEMYENPEHRTQICNFVYYSFGTKYFYLLFCSIFHFERIKFTQTNYFTESG